MIKLSENYSMTSGSLRNYYRKELTDINDNVSEGKSFKCKTKKVGKTTKIAARPRRGKSTTATRNNNFKCCSYYSTQVS